MFNPRKNIEPAHSQIEWGRPDLTTEKALISKLYNKNKKSRVLVNIVMVLITIFLVFTIVYCLFQVSKDIGSIFFYMFGIVPASIILGALWYQYMKGRPYMYPEKQTEIFIFRSKCFQIGTSSRTTTSSKTNRGYYAFFNSKAGKISMLIPYKEYVSNPVGKEYIFYKFNNKTGNKWMNIVSDDLGKH